MEKYINIWRGESAPKDRDALWVHHLERNNSQSPIIISIYKQGKWVNFLDDYMYYEDQDSQNQNDPIEC